jgi:hypothetical protein
MLIRELNGEIADDVFADLLAPQLGAGGCLTLVGAASAPFSANGIPLHQARGTITRLQTKR